MNEVIYTQLKDVLLFLYPPMVVEEVTSTLTTLLYRSTAMAVTLSAETLICAAWQLGNGVEPFRCAQVQNSNLRNCDNVGSGWTCPAL